jgi:hypothetical protein
MPHILDRPIRIRLQRSVIIVAGGVDGRVQSRAAGDHLLPELAGSTTEIAGTLPSWPALGPAGNIAVYSNNFPALDKRRASDTCPDPPSPLDDRRGRVEEAARVVVDGCDDKGFGW